MNVNLYNNLGFIHILKILFHKEIIVKLYSNNPNKKTVLYLLIVPIFQISKHFQRKIVINFLSISFTKHECFYPKERITVECN